MVRPALARIVPPGFRLPQDDASARVPAPGLFLVARRGLRDRSARHLRIGKGKIACRKESKDGS